MDLKELIQKKIVVDKERETAVLHKYSSLRWTQFCAKIDFCEKLENTQIFSAHNLCDPERSYLFKEEDEGHCD